MQVRYHIVPKKQQRTAVLIETKNRTVNIKNVLSKEAAFKELQQKLENWYEIKQIPIASLNSDDNNTLSYRWSLANRDNSAEEFLEDADMPPGFEDDFFPFATLDDEPISMYDEPVECHYVPTESTSVDMQGDDFAYRGTGRRSFKKDVTDPGMVLGLSLIHI